MRKMSKTIIALAAMLLLLFACVEGRAEMLSELNKDPGTFQISENSLDPNSLVNLFNRYFADQLGDNLYASSNDLYADRGIKEIVNNWHVSDNAQIQASFKSAAYGHTLNLLDANGNKVASAGFGAYQFDAMLDDGDASRRTINIGQSGDYNFSLETWFDPSNPIDVFYGDDPTKNSDDMIHMVAFDVTDLVRMMYNDDTIESAYLFGWEDLPVGNGYLDYDYQDLAYIMINVTPNGVGATPEPSTMLIFGMVGCAAAIAAGRRRKQNENEDD